MMSTSSTEPLEVVSSYPELASVRDQLYRLVPTPRTEIPPGIMHLGVQVWKPAKEDPLALVSAIAAALDTIHKGLKDNDPARRTYTPATAFFFLADEITHAQRGYHGTHISIVRPTQLLIRGRWRTIEWDSSNPKPLFLFNKELGAWSYYGDYISRRICYVGDEAWNDEAMAQTKHDIIHGLGHRDVWDLSSEISESDIERAQTRFGEETRRRIVCIGFKRVSWDNELFQSLCAAKTAYIEAIMEEKQAARSSKLDIKAAPQMSDAATKKARLNKSDMHEAKRDLREAEKVQRMRVLKELMRSDKRDKKQRHLDNKLDTRNIIRDVVRGAGNEDA